MFTLRNALTLSSSSSQHCWSTPLETLRCNAIAHLYTHLYARTRTHTQSDRLWLFAVWHCETCRLSIDHRNTRAHPNNEQHSNNKNREHPARIQDIAWRAGEVAQSHNNLTRTEAARYGAGMRILRSRAREDGAIGADRPRRQNTHSQRQLRHSRTQTHTHTRHTRRSDAKHMHTRLDWSVTVERLNGPRACVPWFAVRHSPPSTRR